MPQDMSNLLDALFERPQQRQTPFFDDPELQRKLQEIKRLTALEKKTRDAAALKEMRERVFIVSPPPLTDEEIQDKLYAAMDAAAIRALQLREQYPDVDNVQIASAVVRETQNFQQNYKARDTFGEPTA